MLQYVLFFIIDGFALWILRQAQMSTIHSTVNFFFVNKGSAETTTCLKRDKKIIYIFLFLFYLFIFIYGS